MQKGAILRKCVNTSNDKLSVIVLFSASAATAEFNRTCTLKIKELIILHQFGIMSELSAIRRSSSPLCFGGGGKGQNEKRVPDHKKEPVNTETMSCQLDLYTTSKQHRALWIIE